MSKGRLHFVVGHERAAAGLFDAFEHGVPMLRQDRLRGSVVDARRRSFRPADAEM